MSSVSPPLTAQIPQRPALTRRKKTRLRTNSRFLLSRHVLASEVVVGS
jgi:hypothetical protein